MSQFYIDSEKPHLGGYIVGGDDATYYPDLWRWLVEVRGVKSVIDVGCGEGRAVDYFASLICPSDMDDRLCHVVGIDGVKQPDHPHLFQHDYTEGLLWISDVADLKKFDLCWCCEFVEHVEERYVPNFLDTFSYADLVLMTHAEPGQQGHHHVNTQTPMYWQGVMAAIGYELDPDLTDQTRRIAAMNRNPYNHFARSGLAFIRLR